MVRDTSGEMLGAPVIEHADSGGVASHRPTCIGAENDSNGAELPSTSGEFALAHSGAMACSRSASPPPDCPRPTDPGRPDSPVRSADGVSARLSAPVLGTALLSAPDSASLTMAHAAARSPSAGFSLCPRSRSDSGVERRGGDGDGEGYAVRGRPNGNGDGGASDDPS